MKEVAENSGGPQKTKDICFRTGAAPTVPVPAPAPGGAGQSATPIQLSDLQSILSNIQVCVWIRPPANALQSKTLKSKTYEQVPPGGEAIGAGSSGPSVDLSTALTGEALQPILSQEGFLDKVRSRLVQHCLVSFCNCDEKYFSGESFPSCW